MVPWWWLIVAYLVGVVSVFVATCVGIICEGTQARTQAPKSPFL